MKLMLSLNISIAVSISSVTSITEVLYC